MLRNDTEDLLKGGEHFGSVREVLAIRKDLHDTRECFLSGCKYRTSTLKKFAVCVG